MTTNFIQKRAKTAISESVQSLSEDLLTPKTSMCTFFPPSKGFCKTERIMRDFSDIKAKFPCISTRSEHFRISNGPRRQSDPFFSYEQQHPRLQ